MDVLDIPGIRFKGRSIAIQQLSPNGVAANDDDVRAALELRELLLKDERVSEDKSVNFRWLKIKGKWGYMKF